MPDVLCPICGKPNPKDLEICQFCGGRLMSLPPSAPAGSQQIGTGQAPVQKDTPKFERVKPANVEPILPSETPTKKNIVELDKALPSSPRSMGEKKESKASESNPVQNLPIGPAPSTSANSSGGLPDWLSGLRKASADDEEEIPNWLTGLRVDKADASVPVSAPKTGVASNKTANSSSGTGEEPSAVTMNEPSSQSAEFEQPPLENTRQEGFPDWLQSLQSKPAGGEDAPASMQGEGESLDWLDSLKSESTSSSSVGLPTAYQSEGEMLDWLAGLSGVPEENTPATGLSEGAVPAENLPDWLNQLNGKAIDLERAPGGNEGPAGGTKSGPDWLSDLGPIDRTPELSSGGSIPEWLSNLEAKTDPESGPSATTSSSEQTPSNSAHDDIPDWLSQFQADVNAAAEKESKKEQFEVAPEPTVKKGGAKPLPDWLAGITPTAPTPGGTPALIINDDSNAPGDENETAFSMETPDWLSKIIPESATDKTPQSGAEVPPLENLEVSELPSWVQAMRPVESVVAKAKPTSQEGVEFTEHSGPLAGLIGVLPVGPGLGQLSKPPAYSVKLQATDGQLRYAAALDRLVISETQAQLVKSNHIVSNRLWRWLISILLILAIGLPLVTNIPITQATQLKPTEMMSAFTVISSLPPDAPVLMIFDYDPALSGELEAAAAPLVDHLLLRGPRLTLISTSPTGPALAERFLTDKNVSPLVAGHNYQAGQQYVNLGYLAGGSSGVQYFALSPAEAAPFTVDGQHAWQLPPLQGIQKLSDFATILILTDNADSGRVWIEQTGSAIGSTPLLMVISAQAEPMLLPYYNSGQVKGLVIGLAGGEEYAQTYIHPDGQGRLMQRYWNSFSAGILIAEGLIVLGALWNAFSGWRARRNKTGEEA